MYLGYFDVEITLSCAIKGLHQTHGIPAGSGPYLSAVAYYVIR
jgi:hypothetical protein